MISMISKYIEGSRLIVIRGFKISLDLRTYGNSNQLLQVKLKLLQGHFVYNARMEEQAIEIHS